MRLLTRTLRSTRPPNTQIKILTARSTVWFGQTMASISWIASVLIYDLNSAGDWLQLLAASSWLLANLSGLAIKNE